MLMNRYLKTEEEQHNIALCKQTVMFKLISLDVPKSADTTKTLRE
jgi:hypothetical protein